MKKSLLALAALTAFAGAASAQSSVTLFGRVDLSLAKPIGTDAKSMQNGSGSRLGVRGVEDLGGGLAALFAIEHRFDADTGASQNFNVKMPDGKETGNRFWGAYSWVALRGGFGQVTFGRQYTTAFLGNQVGADPWGFDTIAANAAILTLGKIGKVRNDSAATYQIGAAGFSFAAQVAEATDSISTFKSKPVNFAVGYAAGPLGVSFGYEKTGVNTGAGDEKMWGIGASYNLGMVTPSFWYGRGDAASGAEHRGWLLAARAPLGAGELRASYGTLEAKAAGKTTDVAKQLGLGYHYSMSKRTTLYVDYARDGEKKSDKSGYDVGIKHNF